MSGLPDPVLLTWIFSNLIIEISSDNLYVQ